MPEFALLPPKHMPIRCGSKSLIAQAVAEKRVTFDQVVQGMRVLTGAAYSAGVQLAEVTNKTKKATDRLNAHLMCEVRSSGDIAYLTSPVTGGGVSIGRFSQLFLMATLQGNKQPGEWAEIAWQIISAQGKKFVKAGKTLETAERNLAELTAQAQAFAGEEMPLPLAQRA